MERPYITVSYGQSLDGRIATRTGDSQWIGGTESLQLAHELRRDNDAILVGIGTVLADNPRLTCRIPGGRNPVRIVLDGSLRVPESAALVAGVAEAPTWVVCRPDAPTPQRRRLEALGVRVLPWGPGLDWVGRLSAEGLSTLFVEGGASVITAFLVAGLVDRVLAVTAPLLIGSGIEAVGDLGSRVLAEVRRPLRSRHWSLGHDVATELIYREHPSPPAQ